MKRLILAIAVLAAVAWGQEYAPAWMSDEEVERSGLEREPPKPKPTTTEKPLVIPQPQVAADPLDEMRQYTDRQAMAAYAAAWAAGVPGGGGFYTGRYGLGILHGIVQLGAPILFGIMYTNSTETKIDSGGKVTTTSNPIWLILSVGIPIVSKGIDIYTSHDYVASGQMKY
jgi:hypothetical protein